MTEKESSAEGRSPRVDYVLLVDDHKPALCEAVSPSVMHHMGEALPKHGFEIVWRRGQTIVPKNFTKVSILFS